jgi:hypothetical protein
MSHNREQFPGGGCMTGGEIIASEIRGGHGLRLDLTSRTAGPYAPRGLDRHTAGGLRCYAGGPPAGKRPHLSATSSPEHQVVHRAPNRPRFIRKKCIGELSLTLPCESRSLSRVLPGASAHQPCASRVVAASLACTGETSFPHGFRNGTCGIMPDVRWLIDG